MISLLHINLIQWATDRMYLKYKPMISTTLRNASQIQLEESRRVASSILSDIDDELQARR